METVKAQKARQLRLKPVVRLLNLDMITKDLWEIQEICEEIHWYTDCEDGTDSLINALDGEEDEAYEFKMAFADLCAECEQMRNDLEEEWVPECFDLFFVAAGAGKFGGGLLAWDECGQDYVGIGYPARFAEDDAWWKLKRMTKDDLIMAVRQCLNVYHAYFGLRNRYDSLKAAIDILRDKNTGYLQTVKEIERIYKEAVEAGDWSRAGINWKLYTDALPAEAWIA